MSSGARQTLLIDADDVLWENHALFLAVHRRFHEIMADRGHPADRVDVALLEVERERARRRGYGSRGFGASLIETMRQLAGTVDDAVADEITTAARWIHDHPIVPFEGVAETLAHLARRHRLILVTKGDRTEQQAKVDRSGLAPHFERTVVLAEKDVDAYRQLVVEHEATPGHTWMIGNSPRSDINPARRAGLKTVYIPHHSLWELEDEVIEPPPDLHLERFTELRNHF